MTAGQIKEWLGQFPDDTEVEGFIGYPECPMCELQAVDPVTTRKVCLDLWEGK
jgi:hypothetical protein